MILVYGGEPQTFDRDNDIEIRSQQRSGAVLTYKGDKIPLSGNCLTFGGRGRSSHALVEEGTQDPVACECLSQGQTYVRIGFDLFQEIRFLLTHGQPIANARIPALELHIALLRDLIVSYGIPLLEIPPVPARYSFIACLTHDVDHPGIRHHKFDHTMFGFLYRATVGSFIDFCRGRRPLKHLAVNWMAALSLPFVHLGLAKDFWVQFDRYLDLEKDLTSTFFVVPTKDDPGQSLDGAIRRKRATRYDAAGIAHHLGRLVGAGREIALHGIDAWRDPAKGRAELKRIREVTGASEVGVRMHWLFFSETSPAILEKAGFSYDSTVGYNETVGYRAGTTQAFKPLDVQTILELPLHIMDTALFYPAYMNLSPEQAAAVVRTMVDNAVRFGGVLTVNWHDRSIAPERLWDAAYIHLLDELKTRHAWFATASDSVAWFRKRRSAVIESVTREAAADGSFRVKVSLPNGEDLLPGLTMRLHKPTPSGAPNTDRQFTDITVDRSRNTEV